MKRIVTAVITLLILSLLAVPVFAASASASLTGPGTVRAGDTITLTFNLNGSGLLGASGALSYDSSQVEFKGTKQVIAAPWMVEFNGNNFVAYDNNQTNPINRNSALFTATFTVKSNVAVGTKITISCTGVTASDGGADANVGTITYSATIAAPMSTDNSLKSLTVDNAAISPAFDPNTTSYTAEVPFEVSKLELSGVANDDKAKVSIDSPALEANGTTNVTITVTAENGSTKTYTIAVKRAQDPNYVPSGNNDLAGITVDGFLLSPVFSTENTKYIVWLPYETESIAVSGSAVDSLASVTVEGGSDLKAGADNEVKVICTAENGEQKVYTVIAKRAPAHEATAQPTEPAPTEPNVTGPAQTDPSQTEPAATEPGKPAETQPGKPTLGELAKTSVPIWVTILAAVLSALIGATVTAIIVKKKY